MVNIWQLFYRSTIHEQTERTVQLLLNSLPTSFQRFALRTAQKVRVGELGWKICVKWPFHVWQDVQLTAEYCSEMVNAEYFD